MTSIENIWYNYAMIETIQYGIMHVSLSALMLMAAFVFVSHLAILLYRFAKQSNPAAKTDLQKLVVFGFFLVAITVGGTKPGGNDDDDDSDLITPRRVVYYPVSGEAPCPVPVPTDYGEDPIKAAGFELMTDSYWLSYRFSQSFTTTNDTLEVFASHELPFTNGVKLAKVPIWPNNFGVAFELGKDEVLNLYTNKVVVDTITSLFLQSIPHIDTDNDSYSDAEEALVTKTDINTFDYEDEPIIPEETYAILRLAPVEYPIDPITFANGRPVVSREVGTNDYYVAESGYYNLWCTADDMLNVSIGELSASAIWSTNAHARIDGSAGPAYFEANRSYKVVYEFEDYGGTRDYKYRLVPVLATNQTTSVTNDCCPSFSISTNLFEVSRGTNEAIPMPEVTIEDPENDHCASYSYEIIENEDDKSDWFKKIIYHFHQNGEPKGDAECIYKYSKDKDKKKKCNKCCTEGTTCTNGCVSVSQSFGRSPHIAGLPEGQIVVEESYPTSRLFSNAALKFDHPMMREIVWHNGYDAIIKDGLGEMIEYKDGKPANFSGGLDSYLYHDGTNYIERLSEGIEVIYIQNKVAYLKRDYGARIPVSELGITITRDSNNAISRIHSVADGTMIATNITDRSWLMDWIATDGETPIKRFTFTCENSGDVALEEWRDETFNFTYRWVFDSEVNDWRYEKGVGSERLGITKSRTYDATEKRWNIVEQAVDAQTNIVTSSSSVLDMKRNAAMTIGVYDSSSNSLYSVTRDGRGFVQTETNEKGGTTTYSRDDFGRIISKIEPYADTHTKTTIYSYAPGSRHRYDTRPIRKIVKLDGTTIHHEEYEYAANRKDTYRVFEMMVRHSFVEYDDFGREVLKVAENGRATRTIYDGLDELREEGIYEDGFRLVDGKSTRTELYKSAAGNVTNQVEYAYVGNAWRETKSKSMTYDAAHRVTSTTYSNGKTSAAEYICTGPIWTRDTEGIVVSNEYNSVKALKKSTRFGPHGAVETSYTYDGAGRVIMETRSAVDCPTETHTYTYDNRGRIVSETGFDGKTTTTTYSPDDKITTRTFADGGTEITTVGSDGTLVSITGTAVIPEYYTYGVTPFGETWTRVDYGKEVSPKYKVTYKNAYGEVIRIKRSGFGEEIVDRYTYNQRGELIKETSTDKPDKTYEYNEWGEQTMMIESADGVARYSQDSNSYEREGGEVYSVRSSLVSADGIAAITTTNKVQVSGLTLDNEGTRESIDKYGKYRRELNSFDPTNSVRYIASSYEAVSNIAYQAQLDNLVTETISESAVTNRFEYNAYGWRTAAIDGRGNRTTYEYDAHGNLIRETDAAGGVKSFGYDSMNHMIAETNEVGNVTTYSYDTLGRKVYEGGGTYPVRYGFDEYGNQKTMTTYHSESAAGGGDKTTWVYDAASGLVTQKLYADNHGPTYNYTRDGKLSSRTWARGVTTYYAYDGFGNLTSITYNDGTPSITFTYDSLGRKTSVTDASGTTTFEYDDYGNLVAEIWNGLNGLVFHRYYDEYGRDAGYKIDNGERLTIGYDGNSGRISSFIKGDDTFLWEYLPGTDLKCRVTYPNGVEVDYAYENDRDLITQVLNHVGDTTISSYLYLNDTAGRRTSKNLESYRYNERDELVAAGANLDTPNYSYDYDDIGNRVFSVESGIVRNYSANNLNQYLGADYDLDGNQTNIVTSTGTWAVSYNSENRPVRWENGDVVITMSYDSMGRRVSYRELNGTSEARNVRFLYDGYKLIQELSSDGESVLNEFIWDLSEPIATKPLVYRDATKEAYYLHDANKNVTDLVSSTINEYSNLPEHLALYEYEPFGAVKFSSGTLASLNPFRFSSEYHDDTLGLVYYNYRPYNPLEGRWIGREPNQAEVNLYLFCFNTVMLKCDFLGLSPIDITYVSQGPYFDLAEFEANLLYWNEDITTPSDFNPNKMLKCQDDCVGNLLIISHGGGNEFGGFVSWGDKELYENSDTTEISDMFKDIRFCKECVIEIRACEVGLYQELGNRISKITGCRVKTYKKEVSVRGKEAE